MSSNSSINSSLSLSNSPFVLILLKDYGVSNYYYYVHPILCGMSTFLGIIITIVLSTKKLRTSGPFFQYSLVNTAVGILGNFLFLFLFLNKCGGSICSISTTYWSQAYTIYAIYYISYVYYSSAAIIQIAIGLQLYLSIKQKFKWFIDLNPYKVCAVIYVVFAITSILNIFLYQIDTVFYFELDDHGETTIYKYYYSRLNSNSLYVLICTAVLLITSYSPFIVLIVLNALIYVELRRVMARRKNIIGPSATGTIKPEELSSKSASLAHRRPTIFGGTSNFNEVSMKTASLAVATKDAKSREAQEKKSLRRSLVMTLWVSLIFSLDRLVKCVYRLVVIFMPLSPITYYLNAVSFLIDSLTYISFFFVYMKTNKMFKNKFYEIFLRRKNVN